MPRSQDTNSSTSSALLHFVKECFKIGAIQLIFKADACLLLCYETPHVSDNIKEHSLTFAQ